MEAAAQRCHPRNSARAIGKWCPALEGGEWLAPESSSSVLCIAGALGPSSGPVSSVQGRGRGREPEKQLAGHERGLGREAADPGPSPWVWSGKLKIWRNSQLLTQTRIPSLTGSSTCVCWGLGCLASVVNGHRRRGEAWGGRAQWDWILPSRGSP